MSVFLYKAKRGPKEIVEGRIEADSEDSCLAKLSHLGYFPLSVSKEEDLGSKGASKASFFERVGVHELSIFTRQLSDLLDSGLNLNNALNAIYKQTSYKTLRTAIGDIRNRVRDGQPFSEALACHPKIFSTLYVAMAKSGETGGMLDKILARLADFHESQENLKTKIRSALAYPAVMAGVGLTTIVVLITFVIPKIVTMFEDLGQSLPLPTAILVNISSFTISYWYIILVLIMMAAFTIKRIAKTQEGKVAIDGFKLKLPVMGELIKKSEVSSFARTLGTLLQNGVPILDSLEVISATMQNTVLKNEIIMTHKEVRDGLALSKSLSNRSNFPLFATNMIAVGEEGGNLERALFKVADSFEREADNMIKTMTALLEPFLILSMGLVVGFIVVSMLLPIFQINLIAR